MRAWALGLAILGVALPAQAQAQRPATEAEVKAAYLYRFLSFVEWPAQRLGAPGAPLVVAVAGAAQIAEDLRALVRGRTAQNRPIVVRPIEDADGLAGAHVLFAGRAASRRIAALARAAPPATLVVTDAEGALDQGAMINFVEDGGRIRFAVAADAAERAGLRISSRMLAVAAEVRGRAP
jgi:hypothetical protein